MIKIIDFAPEHSEESSSLIQRSIRASHSGVYSNTEIDSIASEYSAEKMLKKSLNRKIYLAVSNENKILAVGSAKGHEIKGVYVDPSFFGEGIGSLLLEFLENQIRQAGYATAQLFAGLNSKEFYHRKGYEPVRHHSDSNGEAIVMTKKLTT